MMNLPETSDTKNNEGESSRCSSKVALYLSNIYNATKKLVQVPVDDTDVQMKLENDDDDDCNGNIMENRLRSSDSLDEYIDVIAENLLKSCNPAVLASVASNMPSMVNAIKVEDELPAVDDEYAFEEGSNFFYKHRRSDYLRRLLRIMAPISMDVAANICSKVIFADGNASKHNQNTMLNLEFLILMSHWLPVASHLKPIVTEVFCSVDSPWRDILNSGHVDDAATTNAQMFIIAEALQQLCSFYTSFEEISTLCQLSWDWTFVFSMLHGTEEKMGNNISSVENDRLEKNEISSFLPEALKWFSVRILSMLMGWNSCNTNTVLKTQNVDNDRVPWVIHPWEFDQEEVDIEKVFFQRQVLLWNSHNYLIKLPSTEEIQSELTLSPFLSKIGPGITMYKDGTLLCTEQKMNAYRKYSDISSNNIGSSSKTGNLVLTATTYRNLSLLGAAMCQDQYPPPVLVCGAHGSGKSSLIRELLTLCRPNESLMEFHIDEETDSKTLIGSYTITDIPGEFSWRAGALTNASRDGRWVLIEDLDSVPLEIQAALSKLFEERMIPLGNGNYERCHPNFRIFATCTTNSSILSTGGRDGHNLRIGNKRTGGKQIFNPSYWRNIHVKPMPYIELKEVAVSLYPDLPIMVIDSAMTLLRALDQSGRANTADDKNNDSEIKCVDDGKRNVVGVNKMCTGGKIPSVRDLFKFLTRISNGICFEKNTLYITENQRTLCMAESVDIFIGACPNELMKEEFIGSVASPVWGITKDLALNYMMSRKPTMLIGTNFFEIGRAKFDLTKSIGSFQESSTSFSHTSHALRLMESIAVCVRENEPVLLVGETGTGKTTNIQELAASCKRTLVVQNLSLQTDSTDLLGGYRPLEIENVARKIYKDFVDTFVSSFSRKQNIEFLQYVSSMMDKSNWKMLSQSFKRASQLGLEKMKKQKQNKDNFSMDSVMENWENFAKKTERFERQRLSCDAGIAFEFAEGALVDAIQTGKWYDVIVL
jgi:ABC-type lipoprotein export system ATPase subunit